MPHVLAKPLWVRSVRSAGYRSGIASRPASARAVMAGAIALMLSILPTKAQLAEPATSTCSAACVAGKLTFAPVIERTLPSIVSISIKGREPTERSALFGHPVFGRFGRQRASSPQLQDFTAGGSGTIVDADKGLILANVHVIERADEIKVTLHDGREFKGQLVGSDPATDVAVIRIEAKKLRAITRGNSDTVRAGDIILALGAPFGLQGTATLGMVSATLRTGLGYENYESFIQIDAPVNIGNSGGALVDVDGKMIGITTAIMSPDAGNVGVGFAIPINMAVAIMDQIVSHGSVRRGQLGIRGRDLTPNLAEERKLPVISGILVTEILPDTPAAKAGLSIGDVITGIAGKPVRKAGELAAQVALVPVGKSIKLDVANASATRTLVVEIVPLKLPPQIVTVPPTIPAMAGVVLASIEPGHRLFSETMGVEVMHVRWLSRAAQAGLAAGDVIVKLNGRKVRSPARLVELAQGKERFLTLDVVRNGVPITMVVR